MSRGLAGTPARNVRNAGPRRRSWKWRVYFTLRHYFETSLFAVMVGTCLVLIALTRL